jgi:transposase
MCRPGMHHAPPPNMTPQVMRNSAFIASRRSLSLSESASVGQPAAILYTIIESCRRRDLDSYSYPREALTRLPQMTNRQISEVTPEAWSKSRGPFSKSISARA